VGSGWGSLGVRTRVRVAGNAVEGDDRQRDAGSVHYVMM